MANLYDVAKMAGVSKTLVSRVINNQSGVSQKSREAILAAMEELNYTPNGLARSLVLQKTSIIGVILDSLCEPYFFDLIEGIEHEITKSDYRVIFCSGRNRPELKEKYMDFFSSGRTDGVIIYGSSLDDTEVIRNRIRSNFPMVIVENEPEDIELNNVIIENAYGSKLITEHLIKKGCKDIVHVTGNLRVKASLDRRRGYEETMTASGLEDNISVIECFEFGVAEGYETVKKLIKNAKKLPDAIYFGADNTAFGGLLALDELGIDVPRDIKIAGFDDDNPSVYNLPKKVVPLTTIHQPLYDAGVKAVDVLLKQIQDPKSAKQKVVIYPKLVVRESTD